MYVTEIDSLDGTIEDDGTYLTNGGTYYDVTNYDEDLSPDYDYTTFQPDEILVTAWSDEAATIVVAQTDLGTAPASGTWGTDNTTLMADSYGTIKTDLYTQYFRVKCIGTSTTNKGSVVQNTKLLR